MNATLSLPQGLAHAASARFRPAGRFAYHYARGKIGGDAAFAALLQQGMLPARPRWLDLGCGQGSLFALLLAALVGGIWTLSKARRSTFLRLTRQELANDRSLLEDDKP